jgi:transposase
MPTHRPTECRCPPCSQEIDHPEKQRHREVNSFMSILSRQQRALYAAIESNRLGQGGIHLVSEITGLCPNTIRRGRKMMADLLQGITPKVPVPAGGRPRIEVRQPALVAVLEKLLEEETGGDPMREQKWVRSSVNKLTRRLKAQGFNVGHSTVWRLLKRLGFSMKTNIRKRRGNKPDSPERDGQFKYIASKKKEFIAVGLPVISVDTKKKELIGAFRNSGRTWCRQAPEVNEHDFPGTAECRAVPFGLYDPTRNEGYVVVGVSYDTSAFAVNAIARWWEEEGSTAYPGADRLLILADCGGTNGYRSKAWKLNLQDKVCDRYGLMVTVCHYPPGCSKYNPVERRLFSQISINWTGKPLRSLAIMLGYIRGTTTRTGLLVKAQLDEDTYRKGQKVSREEMDQLNLKRHDVCPEWNYTLSPRLQPTHR